jgi:hypothetical protein
VAQLRCLTGMMRHRFARDKLFDSPESNLFQALTLLISNANESIATAAKLTLVALSESMS